MIDLLKPREEFNRGSNDDEFDRINYNVKTMKVTWDNQIDACMSIFIDTTSIKKLEEEKAKNSCQKFMFASISHELRTPLNAFENSLHLIQLKIDLVAAHIDKSINGISKNEVESSLKNLKSIDRFIKIGKVSAKLLMNLVEDILDLEKFEVGTFKLNMGSFDLSALLKDISYIFESQ